MKVVEQSFEMRYPLTIEDWEREMGHIEWAGRTAYKSEERMHGLASAIEFIKMIIGRKHYPVIEFGNMIVKFVTDRGISHEIVRHRLCSFVQESTRYCNYSGNKFDNQCTFIKPSGMGNCYGFEDHCRASEQAYLGALAAGRSPQTARSLLPNALKTEIVVKANFREWRHIFQLRAISKAAHPDMRALMIPLYQHCRNVCPEVFEMGDPE